MPICGDLSTLPCAGLAMPSLDKSEASARAAIAAGIQGKFWEMRDLLHRDYLDWVTLSPAAFRDWILVHAGIWISTFPPSR